MRLRPPSDLFEAIIRKQVRADPKRDWFLYLDEILEGGHEEWIERERAMPHSLAWLYQYILENSRKRAFQSHVRERKTHVNTYETTQIFTPRWIADSLCKFTIKNHKDRIHDPAVGGGQFLLAAYDRLRFLGASPQEAASQISGSEIDATVLKIAKFGLKQRFIQEGLIGIEPKLKQYDLLENAWESEITMTNPPFMGRRSMPSNIREKVDRVKPFHFDLFAATIERCIQFSTKKIAMIAPQSLWFLERHRPARELILEQNRLETFFLLGPKTFAALSGEKSASAGFVLSKHPAQEKMKATKFWDLRSFDTEKKYASLQSLPCCEVKVQEFKKIPGMPLAFFLEQPLLNAFSSMRPLSTIAEIPGAGNKTANNKKYLKALRPLENSEVRKVPGLRFTGNEETDWVVYSKGGRFSPWWGNWNYAIDWSTEAQIFYANNRSSNLLAERHRFRRGLCYSDLGSLAFSVRALPRNTLFDTTGPAIFVENDDIELLDGLMVVLNSTAVRKIVNALNPTLHIQVRDVRRIPIPNDDLKKFAKLGNTLGVLAKELMESQTRVSSKFDQFLKLEYEADCIISRKYGVEATPLNERLIHHQIHHQILSSLNDK